MVWDIDPKKDPKKSDLRNIVHMMMSAQREVTELRMLCTEKENRLKGLESDFINFVRAHSIEENQK